MSEWISVENKLPEPESKVLFYNGIIDTCIYRKGKFCDFDENGYLYEIRHVTHWMPLPNPPEV